MIPNVFILIGPSNLLELSKGKIDLASDIRTLKSWFKVHHTKNWYVVHFSSSNENLELYNKIKMDIEILDQKAVVKAVEYMGEPNECIGHYLLIHHCDKNECYDVLNELLKPMNGCILDS